MSVGNRRSHRSSLAHGTVYTRVVNDVFEFRLSLLSREIRGVKRRRGFEGRGNGRADRLRFGDIERQREQGSSLGDRRRHRSGCAVENNGRGT